MEPQGHHDSIQVKLGQTIFFGSDKFLRIVHIEQGRYFHKFYVNIKEGKLFSNKIIKIMNTNCFELGGVLFLKGNDIESILVNGNEIL